MRTQDIEYRADGVRMVGQYVVDDSSAARRPGVLIIHEGPGLTEHTKKIAARLAGLGYAASPWTTTVRASRTPIRPRCGRRSPPGSPTRPASWPVPRRRSTC